MRAKEASKILSYYPHVSLIDRFHISIRLRRSYFDQVEKYLPKKGSFLDFGCGHGFFALYLAEKSKDRKIIGTDISKKKIDIANSIPNSTIKFIYKKNTLDLIKNPNQYDCVAILNVLYLFDKKGQENVIRKTAVSLKKNGVMVLIDHDSSLSFMTLYTHLREFLMLKILHLTLGSTLTFNPHSWWLPLLKENFREVTYHNLDKKGFQKLYICKK